jgi:hypothetical protein
MQFWEDPIATNHLHYFLRYVCDRITSTLFGHYLNLLAALACSEDCAQNVIFPLQFYDICLLLLGLFIFEE